MTIKLPGIENDLIPIRPVNKGSAIDATRRRANSEPEHQAGSGRNFAELFSDLEDEARRAHAAQRREADSPHPADLRRDAYFPLVNPTVIVPPRRLPGAALPIDDDGDVTEFESTGDPSLEVFPTGSRRLQVDADQENEPSASLPSWLPWLAAIAGVALLFLIVSF